jgi:hypothetical protein
MASLEGDGWLAGAARSGCVKENKSQDASMILIPKEIL